MGIQAGNRRARPAPHGSPPLPHPHRVVIGAGLLVGLAGNMVLRSPAGPGLGMLLFFVALAVAIAAACRGFGRLPSGEAWSWIGAGILLSSVFVFRASHALQTFAFIAASAAFAFPALRAGAPWMRGSGVVDHLEAAAGAAGYAGLGAFRLGAVARTLHVGPGGVPPATSPTAGTWPSDVQGPRPAVLPAVLRGLLLSAPLLFVFGALFVSADRAFAVLVSGLLGTALDEWASHVVVTCVVAWLATGYLTGFLTGTRVRDIVEVRFRRPSLGMVEIGIPLGLVSALFAAFVAVQFRYLFGGAGLVEVTTGLTYAEYAREGFGQLALASALVIPTLLVSDWLLGRPGPRARAIFGSMGALQLLLLFLVIVSAFQRVRAYQDAYGLTEPRFYGVAFLGWLTLVGAWFGVTVLRGRREQFAFPALLSAFVLVIALFAVNPDAWIARANLARSESALVSPTPGSPGFDADYLASLSADAVPTLLDALPHLPSDAQCRLAAHLLERWGNGAASDWRSWNLATARARGRVRAEGSELQRRIGMGGACARTP
ncbi:MAG: DUF4173 domain-containing protein [Gemmatimonadales bacterium]|nr:MAG: DUF4173 domain-containing protein [Gemmatimonadales bacterium]